MGILTTPLKYLACDKLSVFLFHKIPTIVDPLVPDDLDLANFAATIDFVKTHFEILPLDVAMQRLQADKLPFGAACITFDDGYAEWLNGPARLLARESIPATFFLTTGQFEGRPMWHERIAHALRHTPGPRWETQALHIPPLDISTPQTRAKSLKRMEHHLKYTPLKLREHYLDILEDAAGTKPAQVPRIPAEDVRRLAALGFEIGAHTHEHPILALCESDEAISEIGRCREILEEVTKSRVRSFAYPNGRPHVDFSARHIDMVRAAGYSTAVTTQWGAARATTSPMQIPRFTPWGPGSAQMSLQMMRNLLTSPEYLEEQS